MGGVRPIGVGDTMRSLVAKWLLVTAQGRTAAAALPTLQTAFAKSAPLLVGREVIVLTRGVQRGDPMSPFLFATGIQAALEALPPGSTMHRWYLDDGVIMGSVVEVEEVLAALQQALHPLGLELNTRKTTEWGPGLVPAASTLAAAARLHLEQGTEVLGVSIQSHLHTSAE